MMLFASKENFQHISNRVCYNEEFSEALYFRNRLKSNMFFDFETTFDEDNLYKRRGYRDIEHSDVRE